MPTRTMRSALGVAAALAVLSACGPTVGDACTTDGDCGHGICLQGAGAPGGYCTVACQGNGSGTCPNGSTCASDPGPGGASHCRLTCTTDQGCRTGYTCTGAQGNARVCLGP
jgi:hypothetical protein